MWPHDIDFSIQAGSIVDLRLMDKFDVNLNTAIQDGNSRKREREVIPAATTVLDIPGLGSPDSSAKWLKGALLGIKAPGTKIIRKMSKS